MTAAPPPGRAGLPPGPFRIDREGSWCHEGQEVTHPGIVENLYANLRADADGHYLQVGPARIPVHVDDAPFVVTRVEVPPPGGGHAATLRLHLSDGSQESLPPESGGVWIGVKNTPYCRVKSGRFTARFAVAAWLQLAHLLQEESGTGRAVLVLGGRRVPLERRS